MSQRPDPLETLLLALELLRRIPRNRKISAGELHDQIKSAGLERDIRTVHRHLQMLSQHFDIEFDDRNKPHGYKWKERAQGLAVPMLNEQESLLLMLAEQHLKNLLPASLMKSMSSFFAQAHANLRPTTNSKLAREWLTKVRVVSTTQPLLPPKIRPGVFETVSNALYANRWLRLDYRNSSGKRATVEVMPLGLAQQGPRFYLVCRYKGFDNERSLALHRILAAEATEMTFDRPGDFDLQKYDDDGRFGFGEGRRIRLTFRIDKGVGYHLLESPLSVDQKVTELEDEYEIAATVVETAQLEWWLRGYGQGISLVRRDQIDAT